MIKLAAKMGYLCDGNKVKISAFLSQPLNHKIKEVTSFKLQ